MTRRNCECIILTSKRIEMIDERRIAPQHDLHANQTGNAGDYTSSAHSNLPWRRLGRFIAIMVLASFVMNEIWEMAQMSAYVETASHSWMGTISFCSWAALGDVGIILGIYAAGALAAGDPAWGLRSRWNIYATVAVMGLAYAALVEHAALAAGRWSYSERMPVVSVLGAGLWPLLQMTLLPPLTFLFARFWAGRSAANHTDGWMGGWAGGQMSIWAVLAVLVVVVVVLRSLLRKK